MSETISQVLTWIGGILGGISVSAIITAIICGVLKGGFSKAVSKIDVEGIAEKTTEKSIERIKDVSFKQSIQPIVEAELEKVNVKSREFIEKALEETQARYDKLIKVIESLASYFDNSIGVSEEAKENLRKAIKDAEILPVADNNIEIEEIVVEEEIKPKKTKSAVKVQR